MTRGHRAIVRRATAADVPACVAIVRSSPEYFTEGVPASVEEDMAVHPGWVATAGGWVVAFAVVRRPGPGAAEILWAAVATELRSCGVGSALVGVVLDELTDEGVRVVEVKTLDLSAGYDPYVASYGFWVARGFVPIDVIDPLPGWPPGNPAAIMVAALAPTRA
jgi:GNAT superfamily N-acetyltransferase